MPGPRGMSCQLPRESQWKIWKVEVTWIHLKKKCINEFSSTFGHEQRRNRMKAIGIATITFFTNVGNSQCHLQPQKTNENHSSGMCTAFPVCPSHGWFIYDIVLPTWSTLTHSLWWPQKPQTLGHAGTPGTPDVSSQGLSATSRSA